ncbi:hypothetical protein NIES4071_61580 [Calothrix sp. NIES-4071]|nr:hypothetical protein NIES4071_61580 [Calothrix sp. NIES-4071]BAZ60462.1 hypothetical protein NIES4105_61530 [Calothrix sp. NIES-4105]
MLVSYFTGAFAAPVEGSYLAPGNLNVKAATKYHRRQAFNSKCDWNDYLA